MRKLLMLVMMLLVPALASAWTVPVKVTNTTAGITAGNKATVTYTGLAATDVAVGTKYFYPTSAIASISVAVAHSENVTSITLDGVAQAKNASGVTTVIIPQKTLSALNIVYASAATVAKSDISLTPGTGGLTSLAIGKSSTTIGYTDVAVGTTVTVKAQPNAGYKFTKFTINGSDDVTGAGSTSPVTKSFTVTSAAPNTVVAYYDVAPSLAATLSAPASGSTGSQVQAVTIATSNVTPVNYAYSTTCGGASQAAGTNNTYLFVPTVVGTCAVTVTVTAPGVPDVMQTASLTIADGVASANFTCTSCHSGNTPTVVAAYNRSAHVGKSVGCQNCHTSSAHTTVVQASTCESCHSATLSTTTHPVAITAAKCLVCHDSHDPAAGIANLGPAPAHPAVTLYTFEEIGMQMAGGAKVPVQVDANGKGMPYSPKQTCGTAGCHIKNGVDYTYDKISDHAFHSGQGRSEYQDSSDGKYNATKNKPWLQSTAMVGKW